MSCKINILIPILTQKPFRKNTRAQYKNITVKYLAQVSFQHLVCMYNLGYSLNINLILKCCETLG